MGPAEAADLTFHTALLMGTRKPGAAKERVEPVFSELTGRRMSFVGSGFQEFIVAVGIPSSAVFTC